MPGHRPKRILPDSGLAPRADSLGAAIERRTLEDCRRKLRRKDGLPTAAQLTYAGHGVKKLAAVYDPALVRAFPVSCMWVFTQEDSHWDETGIQSKHCGYHATYVFGMGARHPRYYCTRHAKLILTNQERHKSWCKKPKKEAVA